MTHTGLWHGACLREGRLPLFLRELHRLVALGVKVLRRWEGAVWDHERPSVVHLRTPQAVLEKLAYIMANPVAAGLVHHAHQWPGLCTLPHELGRAELSASRPEAYLDADNPCWPARHTLRLHMPQLPGMSEQQVRQRVERLLQELERHRAAGEKRPAEGRSLVTQTAAGAQPTAQSRRHRLFNPGRVAEVEKGRGTIGGLMMDPSVYEDLESVLGNVERNVLLNSLIRFTIKEGDIERPANQAVRRVAEQ